eukprot:TRINITY_DN4488_c1_g1_i2.p1 TRINITY_DN4488_c1_g1~~TRINITY_DN4488_c1_g1_i2.p1  ORF type:complete len:177 (+),score=5.90 TRINITY_DN4488_c1_g1_i2:58-588(+)
MLGTCNFLQTGFSRAHRRRRQEECSYIAAQCQRDEQPLLQAAYTRIRKAKMTQPWRLATHSRYGRTTLLHVGTGVPSLCQTRGVDVGAATQLSAASHRKRPLASDLSFNLFIVQSRSFKYAARQTTEEAELIPREHGWHLLGNETSAALSIMHASSSRQPSCIASKACSGLQALHD